MCVYNHADVITKLGCISRGFKLVGTSIFAKYVTDIENELITQHLRH